MRLLKPYLQGCWRLNQDGDFLDANRHRWYQCDKLHKVNATETVNCYLAMAHPGDCMVRWQDALWWASPNGYEDHAPRLALVIELGGPNDVKLIEEPDFGVIWDRVVPKQEMTLKYESFFDVPTFLKWDGVKWV